MAIHRELERAQRRTQGAQKLLDQRRAQLGARLQQIVTAGPCTQAGQRYVLAQNVGAVDRPLWAYLSLADQATGQLVFSGNRVPVEFTEAQAVELAPELGTFTTAVQFIAIADSMDIATTWPESARRRVGKADGQSLSHRLRVAVVRHAHLAVVKRLLACSVLLLPCTGKASALPPMQPQFESVEVNDAGSRAVNARVLEFRQQPGSDGRSGLVELLAEVTPESSSMADQQSEKKGEQRQTLPRKQDVERIHHDNEDKSKSELDWLHIALMGLMGFAIGGGFSGGEERRHRKSSGPRNSVNSK